MLDLGFDEERNEVIAPTWRQDLERLADLAEEVARFYGYDKIPTNPAFWRSYAQARFPLSFGLNRWQGRLRNSADSPRE